MTEQQTFLSLIDITLDRQFQPRDSLDGTNVNNLKDAYEEGADIPPVTIWKDGDSSFLIEGFHRFRAAQLVGLKELPVQYFKGSRAEAMAYAFRVNSTHGLLLSRTDRVKYLKRLLDIEPYKSLSSRKAAEAIGDKSLYKFIQRLRNKTQQTTSSFSDKNTQNNSVEDTQPITDGAKLRIEIERLQADNENLRAEIKTLKQKLLQSHENAPESFSNNSDDKNPILLEQKISGLTREQQNDVLRRMSCVPGLVDWKKGKAYVSLTAVETVDKIIKEIKNQ
jgi:hypothetical protein